MPANTGEFATRLDAAQQRLVSIQQRLAASKQRQNQYLAQIAIDELAAQKERLDASQVQARFALAAIYDRAATAPAVRDVEAPAAGATPEAAPATEAAPAGGGAP